MDMDGQRLGLGYMPTELISPQPGWIEQDPCAVAAGAAQAIEQALQAAQCEPSDIAAIGIASQRGSDFIWDARTGRPIANAITWQDLRTLPIIEALNAWEHADQRRYRLGYFPGPWCASMHLSWRAQHQPEFQTAVREGYLRVGMSASWLITALGTPARAHVHDYSLVQKTGLWDFRNGRYWSEWIDRLGLQSTGLPAPAPTLHDYGTLRIGAGSRCADIPVVAMIGDQQAALFGHGCRVAGQAECTHGTATFVNVVTGYTPPDLDSLNVYHAWSLPRETSNFHAERPVSSAQHTYCLEADTTVSGAAVRWMTERGHLFDSESELDALAASVSDDGGVMFVPAFTGLNVPYNDHSARATIFGLTLGTDRAHIAHAFLDSLGYQLRAILETIRDQTGLHVRQLSVGGGLSKSEMACQVQADLLGIPLVRPTENETTARGAALLAGLGLGRWNTIDDLPLLPSSSKYFEPHLSSDQRDAGYARWQRAVQYVREIGENQA